MPSEQLLYDYELKFMIPAYDLDKIKFATDEPTFDKAVGLYEAGKVTNFKIIRDGFSAIVEGGSPYNVRVSARRYDEGDCDCYLGQEDTLCKHMVATAIMAVMTGEKLTEKDKQTISAPIFIGRSEELSKEEILDVKKEISAAMKYIKPYNGPSRVWFAYQGSLSEGCNRLSAIISELPASEKTAVLLVDLLLRLDDKLCRSGIDDSDGTVGRFIEETVNILLEFAKVAPICSKAFEKLRGKKTCFDWEEPLLNFIDTIK